MLSDDDEGVIPLVQPPGIDGAVDTALIAAALIQYLDVDGPRAMPVQHSDGICASLEKAIDGGIDLLSQKAFCKIVVEVTWRAVVLEL